MKINESDLFKLLADGEFHSGQQLASAMNVSRTAIWKHLDNLRSKGVEIEAIKGKGYRLSSPIEMLDRQVIITNLNSDAADQLQDLQLHYQLDSTSRLLSSRTASQSIHASVVMAEYQTDGKGRGNNQWLTAPAAGLCISIGWHFDSTPKTLTALSLATGVVLAECLTASGSVPVRLKWPNDLVYDGAKLGGILIESRGQLAGAVDVIIGIGLNIRMPSALATKITQRVTDLSQVFGYTPSRNQLAANIISSMFSMLENYAVLGFETRIDKWRQLDITRGSNAILHRVGGDVSGRVVDIDENGFLIMAVNGKLARFSSGDLSIRISN